MGGARFGVLGPMTVWRDGEVVTPTSATQRALLGVLLLAENRPLSTERMAALLRPGDALSDTRSWGQVAVSRLRAWLARTDTRITVVRRTDGYLLEVPDESVDVGRFRRLHAEATKAEPAQQVELWTAALELWRGPVLADVAAELHDDNFVLPIEELRVTAALGLAEAALATTAPHRALPHLTELTKTRPLDERLPAARALLLAGCGRQGEALHLIERTRRLLADELGVDLGEHLRDAQLRVLRQQAMPLAPVQQAVGPAARWRGPQWDATVLIGRDRDGQALEEALGHRRVVTVTGPGGCGKTALAAHVARKTESHFNDGVVVVGLSALRSGGEVITALASLMNVSAPTIDQTLVALTHALASRHVLLLLDNCEHLIADCVELIRHLLHHTPHVTVLTTSRQAIGVVGEWVWTLAPLEVPDEGARVDPATPAVRLFLRRATEVSPTLTVTESDLQLAGSLCRRLDGLPLAIELAAARLRALTIAQLAQRLEQSLVLLEGPARTLSATIDWSFRLLTASEKRLLTHLTVFRGSFSLETVEAVCGEPGDDVLLDLVALVERSLVLTRDDGEERRYALLTTVREFVSERLTDRERVHDRLLDHWLRVGRAIDAMPHYSDRMRRARALAGDGENLRAALDHGFDGTRQADAAELVVRLAPFWLANRAHLGGSEVRMRQAAEHAAQCTPEVRSLLLYQSAVRRALREDYVGAREEMAAVLPQVSRQREYRDGLVSVVTNGRFVLNPVVLEQIPLTLTALPEHEEGDEPSTALTACAGAYGTWGRFPEAVELCARYAARAARRGTPFSVSHQVVRAEVAMGTGAVDEAVTWSKLLTEQLPTAGSPLEQEPARRAIALVLLTTAKDASAVEFLSSSVTELERCYPPELARGTAHLGVLLAQALRRSGEPRRAREVLARALSQAVRRSHLRVGFTGALTAALIAADLGDTDSSRSLTRSWDVLRRRIGLPVPLGFADAPPTLGFDEGASGTPDATWQWRAEALQEVIGEAHRWSVGLNQEAVNRRAGY